MTDAMSESFRSWLLSGLEIMDISISESAIDSLFVYFTELKKWSKKVNLISQSDDRDIVESHFLDSLSLIPQLKEYSADNLADVGTGAGFPGLALKLVCPDLKVALVEPRHKRVAFLNHIRRQTGVGNIDVVCERLGEENTGFVEKYGQFSFVTCRALTSIVDFLDMVSPVVLEKGRVICMKGPQAEQEIQEWQDNGGAGFSLEKKIELKLPFSNAYRCLVVFQKM